MWLGIRKNKADQNEILFFLYMDKKGKMIFIGTPLKASIPNKILKCIQVNGLLILDGFSTNIENKSTNIENKSEVIVSWLPAYTKIQVKSGVSNVIAETLSENRSSSHTLCLDGR